MKSDDLLPYIVGFKAFKAVTLTALGIALLATRHSDLVDILFRVAPAIHLPLTSRLFERALELIANLTIPRQTLLAITAFAYAALMTVEGVSLYLRKPWGRWFTIVATSSLIPIEIYEIAREPRPAPVIVLIANVAVVLYLVRRPL